MTEPSNPLGRQDDIGALLRKYPYEMRELANLAVDAGHVIGLPRRSEPDHSGIMSWVGRALGIMPPASQSSDTITAQLLQRTTKLTQRVVSDIMESEDDNRPAEHRAEASFAAIKALGNWVASIQTSAAEASAARCR